MARDVDRKADAYRKIKFGGLIIKAGAEQLPVAVVVGALVAALRDMADDPTGAVERRFRALGDATFGGRSPSAD